MDSKRRTNDDEATVLRDLDLLGVALVPTEEAFEGCVVGPVEEP